MINRDVHDCTRWTGNVLKMLRGPIDKALYADDSHSGSPGGARSGGNGSGGLNGLGALGENGAGNGIRGGGDGAITPASANGGGSFVSPPSSAAASVVMFNHPNVGSSFELA